MCHNDGAPSDGIIVRSGYKRSPPWEGRNEPPRSPKGREDAAERPWSPQASLHQLRACRPAHDQGTLLAAVANRTGRLSARQKDTVGWCKAHPSRGSDIAAL